MKKNIKMILTIVITAIICISGTVYATTKYLASDVIYKDKTVEKALNELYNSKGNSECVTGSVKHEANTQLSIDIGFQPSLMLFTYNMGSELDFDVYAKHLDSKYTYYSYINNGSGTEKNDRIKITNGNIKTTYDTSWMRYKYSYNVVYMACK